MKAIRVHAYGGPEVLQLEDVETPKPKEGQALVRVGAAGVNSMDLGQRARANPLVAGLPFTPGWEGAGVVEAVGPGADHVKVGDRVAWEMVLGAYATHAVVPADRLVPIPKAVDTKAAAAVMIPGLTAQILTESVYNVGPRDTCLVHSAAGGVASFIVQMCKMRGARVIGTVSSADKAQFAREIGADDVVIYTEADWVEQVKQLTGGAGAHVVYDGVGKETFEKSLEAARMRGYVVQFGRVSGPLDPLDTGKISRKSLFFTSPSMAHYTSDRAELLKRSDEVFGWIASGKLQIHTHEYPLGDAAKAHEALASRKVKGKLLLEA